MRAEVVFETAASGAGQTPRTAGGSTIEARHVDSAAENAKRAAAAVGLGSLFPTIDSASLNLKRNASPRPDIGTRSPFFEPPRPPSPQLRVAGAHSPPSHSPRGGFVDTLFEATPKSSFSKACLAFQLALLQAPWGQASLMCLHQ